MAAATGGTSVLLGFSVCPLCGGKTHVKRKQEEGKRPYSHCLDEHDKGCSHTHYATNKAQEALMLEKTRALKPLAGGNATTQVAAEVEDPAPTPTGAKQEPEPAPVVTPTPTPTPEEKPRRRRLFL